MFLSEAVQPSEQSCTGDDVPNGTAPDEPAAKRNKFKRNTTANTNLSGV